MKYPMKKVSDARIERWLGKEKAEHISNNFRHWYGPPCPLVDVPGAVLVTGGGDFVGHFNRGAFASAMDHYHDFSVRLRRLYPQIYRQTVQALRAQGIQVAGFSSLSDLIAEAAGGKRQYIGGGPIQRAGVTGVAGAANTLWNVGSQPAAGGAASAAPGGRQCTSATTGALTFQNAAGGDTLHLTGADLASTVAFMTLMIYDRLFDVTKTMSSTATEAVTGTLSRYNNTTSSAADYAGGNFLFVECTGVLSATAHNWTVCQYTNQAGTTTQTLPSLTGNSANIVNRLDHPTTTPWFAPLASGDTGIKALTQMQCSASVTGTINFVIGHMLGMATFPVANSIYPFDWVTNRDILPRIFDNACVSLLELKSATTAATYHGQLTAVSG